VKELVEREWVLGQDEWSETIESLLNGQDEITLEELLSAVPEAEEDPELLESLMTELSGLGISIIESEGDEERESEMETVADDELDLNSIPADDLLSVYLAEMSQEPLLTHAEEIELAQAIELGRQARRTLEQTDYTPQEYQRLQALVDAGQAAREHLGRANTRLVVSIAKRYRGFGIPFTDLIQDGNVGLMRAVDRYDHRTGNRFSTYATWWIRQAVTRSLANHGRIIRIPVHKGGRMR
jgi:RNA polymerase primary sigma factor